MVNLKNMASKLAIGTATIAAAASLAAAAPIPGLVKEHVAKTNTEKHVDTFSIDINGKPVFNGSQRDIGNNYKERADYLKPVFEKNNMSRKRTEFKRNKINYSKNVDKKFYPVQSNGKILNLLNPNNKSDKYDISVTVKDKNTGKIVKSLGTKKFLKPVNTNLEKKVFDYFKFVDAKSGKVINTHPGFRVLDSNTVKYTNDMIKQLKEVENKIGNRLGGWVTLNSINSKPIGQNKRNSDKASFYVQKNKANHSYLNHTLNGLNNGKSDMVFLQTIRPEDFAKYMENYKSEKSSDNKTPVITTLYKKKVTKNLAKPTGPVKEVILNSPQRITEVKTPEIRSANSEIKGLNGVSLKSEKTLESKINGEYTIYLDHDDKKDLLKVNLIPGQDKELVKVKYGNGKTGVYSLDEVRSDILKTFEFTDRDSNDKVTKKYLMAADGSGKEVVKFMIDTNKYSTRMTDEKNVNANTQTRLSNSGAVIGFVDKVANAKVRGEYIVKNFIEKYGNNLTIKDNKFARNVYAGSFSDDVSFGRWFGLGFVANSAIYTTFTSDFLPRIEEDAALAQSRGANMNTYAVKIQNDGIENLLNNSKLAYKGLVEMYKGNIEATKIKMRSNQF